MNESLLEQLRRSAGQWVSGETLRQSAGISRMAISKQIRRLVGLGYEIESSPRRGYRLQREPEALDAESMRPRLAGTRFAGGMWEWKQRTESTNDDARALALAGAPEGSVVVADAQERGRGRRGRVWVGGGAGDSLLFSVLLRPPIEPRMGGLLPLLASVALERALAGLGLRGVGIKWPNDVLAGGRKLCGILCEMSLDMDRIESAVLGIGLNVNAGEGDFPEEIRAVACSMRSLGGRTWSRAAVLEAVLRELDGLLTQAWTEGFSGVLDAWRSASVTLGKVVCVTMPDGSRVEGVAEDVAEDGALVLRTGQGGIRRLHSGEILLGPRPAA